MGSHWQFSFDQGIPHIQETNCRCVLLAESHTDCIISETQELMSSYPETVFFKDNNNFPIAVSVTGDRNIVSHTLPLK